MITEERLQEIARELEVYENDYDSSEAEAIEVEFPDTIRELIGEIREARK